MSFFRKTFGKKHKYETQADLQGFTVEEIIRINPSDVGSYIEEETGGNPLTGDKLKALKKLLAFKRNIPKGRPVPESMIQQYLNEEAQINKLMGEATGEIVKEYKQKTIDDLNMLDLERRKAALNNQMPQSVTKDEGTKRKWTNLGGRTRKPRKVRKIKKSFRKAKKSLKKSRKMRRKQKV
jgi:hypothetical protein